MNHSPFAKGDHSAVDIIGKRAVEYVPPNENSDTRLPAITTGSGLFGRRDWGPMPLGPGFATGDGGGLPDDDRQIQGAFRLAQFRAAKGFTPGADNRAPAQRPSQSHQ